MRSESNTLERDAFPIPTFSGTRVSLDLLDGWAGLADEWDALFDACPWPSLCARRAWVEAWWEAFGARAEGAGRGTALLVGVARDGDGLLVGLIPLFEERARGRVRRLRSVGFLGREGVHDMTEEPTVLLRPGHEAAVLRAFAEALRPHLRRGRWDLVLFRILSGDPAPLDDAFAVLGCWSRFERRPGPFVAALPDTWVGYRRELTKSMRDNLGYYPRLLTRRGHDWSVRTLREPAAVREAAGRLADLHAARAAQGRGRGHANHVHGPAHREFLASLLARMAAEGKGFVAELVVGGEVVAAQAFLEDRDTLMVYYSGYREAWYDLSPVFVIDAAVLQEAQARGVRRVDFLTARAAWKTRWNAVPGAPLHRAFLVPLRPACLARALAYLLGLLWRRDVVGRLPRLRRRARERVARWRDSIMEAWRSPRSSNA